MRQKTNKRRIRHAELALYCGPYCGRHSMLPSLGVSESVVSVQRTVSEIGCRGVGDMGPTFGFKLLMPGKIIVFERYSAL